MAIANSYHGGPERCFLNSLLVFVSEALANGRRLKCLTVANDFSYECIDIAVDHGISDAYVTSPLDQAACFRGLQQAVCINNDPKFIGCAFIVAQIKSIIMS